MVVTLFFFSVFIDNLYYNYLYFNVNSFKYYAVTLGTD